MIGIIEWEKLSEFSRNILNNSIKVIKDITDNLEIIIHPETLK